MGSVASHVSRASDEQRFRSKADVPAASIPKANMEYSDVVEVPALVAIGSQKSVATAASKVTLATATPEPREPDCRSTKSDLEDGTVDHSIDMASHRETKCRIPSAIKFADASNAMLPPLHAAPEPHQENSIPTLPFMMISS